MTSFRTFVTQVGPFLGGALVLLLVLTLAYCAGRSAGKGSEVADQQERTIKLQEDEARAAATAAADRLTDQLELDQQKDDLDAAIQDHENPDVLRARRGCLVMRQQGRDTAGIAACRRFEVQF